MGSMFTALATFIYRRRWWTLAASTIFLAAAIGMVLRGGRLTGGSFGDGEAERTQRFVEQVLGHSTDTAFVVIFHSDALVPKEPSFRAAMKAALDPLAGDPDVLSVVTPEGAPFPLATDMVNGGAKSALALVSMKGDFKGALSRYPAVRARLRSDVLTIKCTGKIPFMDDF